MLNRFNFDFFIQIECKIYWIKFNLFLKYDFEITTDPKGNQKISLITMWLSMWFYVQLKSCGWVHVFCLFFLTKNSRPKQNQKIQVKTQIIQ